MLMMYNYVASISLLNNRIDNDRCYWCTLTCICCINFNFVQFRSTKDSGILIGHCMRIESWLAIQKVGTLCFTDNYWFFYCVLPGLEADHLFFDF